MIDRSYFLNSLNGWKDRFEFEQKAALSRLRFLQRAGHPDQADQEKLIEIRQSWINRIETEIKHASPSIASHEIHPKE